MSAGRTHGQKVARRYRITSILAVAGAAVSLSAPVDAVSLQRILLRQNVLDSAAGGMGSAGSTVTLGNLDLGHVLDTHVAFGDRVTRVWWPVDDASIGSGAARGQFFTAHATAVASAMTGNLPFVTGNPIVRSVVGFAPSVPTLLSGGIAFARNPLGSFDGETENSKAFALLAMTDRDFADTAATLLGIEPYPLAQVVNMSFGNVNFERNRLGNSMFNHVLDMTAVRTGALLVAAVGDEDENPILEQQMEDDPDDPGGTIGAPATSWNLLAVGRIDESGNSAADKSGSGPVGVVDHRISAVTMLSSIAPMTIAESCPQPNALPSIIPSNRPAVHLAAPGDFLGLASRPDFDDLSQVPPSISNTAVSGQWTGTSFSSAIVAGVAAVAYDIGTKNGYWTLNEDGQSRAASLAVRAIIINSANDTTASPQLQTQTGGGGLEGGACVFTRQLGEKLGAGAVDPERVRKQLIANMAADVRPDRPLIVDGLVRPLFGLTRGNSFEPEPADPADRFLEGPLLPPEMQPPGTIAAMVTGGAAPPAQDWFGPWLEDTIETIGTPFDRPFVTTVELPTIPPGMVRADDDAGLDEIQPKTRLDGSGSDASTNGDRRAPRTNAEVEAGGSVPYGGQPVLIERPQIDLDDARFDLGSPTGLSQEPAPFPGGGATGGPGGGGGGLPVKTGWDVGRMGLGFIDYPLGIITPGSSIRASMVWDRFEQWTESGLNSLRDPLNFPNLGSNFGPLRPRAATQIFDITGSDFPPPSMSEPGFELPLMQEAFSQENFELELYRVNPGGGNELIAASRAEWSTVEHISVGEGAQCTPDAEILFGAYFLRIIYKETLFDLGGYRWCSDIQSLQIMRPGTNSTEPYLNMRPAEAEFGVAWYIDLAPSAEVGFITEAVESPVDMNNDGVTDNADQMLMVQAMKGDLNLDGVVNAGDLAILLSKYGTDDVLADFNQDGIVDGTDLLNVISKFGQTP